MNTRVTLFYILFASILFNSILVSNTSLTLVELNNIKYIKATDLAKSYNANTIFYPDKDKLEIRAPNLKITLSPFSSFIKVDDDIYHLQTQVLYENKDFFIPFNSFVSIANKTKLPNIASDIKNNQVKLNGPDFNIHNFIINKKINGTLININTSKYFPSKSISASISRGGWLNITIPNGHLDSLQISEVKIKSPILRLKTYQSNESCQLSFLLKNKVDDIEINSVDKGISIVLRMSTNTNSTKNYESDVL